MLILTRRLRESVKIGDEVTVTVLGVKGAHVRLGFTAPKEVAVHREEVYERIQGAAIEFAQTPRRKWACYSTVRGEEEPAAQRRSAVDADVPTSDRPIAHAV